MNGYEKFTRAFLRMCLDLGWEIIAVLMCLFLERIILKNVD